MARMRSVKPEFWDDRKLAKSVSRDARLLYIALWNEADEYARLHGDVSYIKGHCFPYDDDLTLAGIHALLEELTAAGRVVPYSHDGDPYLFLPKLNKHQRLDDRVSSRLPAPPDSPLEQVPETDPSEINTSPSESHADSSGSHADPSEEIDAKHVAGGMLHVAGSRGVGADAPRDDLPVESRPDVTAICDRLAHRMTENGCKPPTVTAKWRDAARLLLDRDDRPLAEVLALIDWTQDDAFWRANVQSLPKFREKYDQLRLQASRSRDGPPQSRNEAILRHAYAEAQTEARTLP